MCLAGLEEQQLTLSPVSVGGGSVTALWFSSPGASEPELSGWHRRAQLEGCSI